MHVWLKSRSFLVALAALFGLACSSLQASGLQLVPERSLAWKDFLGVNAHFLWFEPQAYQQQMSMLQKLGLEWVRVDIHWDRHETSEEVYRLQELDLLMDEISKKKLKSLVYVVGSAGHATSAPPGSPTPDQYPPRKPEMFGKFMYRLASRYQGVDAWQVWNEPNIPAYWRPAENPKAYGELLLTSVQALRLVDPDKPVVMGGMAYYSQMPVKGGLMLEALGGLGVQKLDTVVAYHPYTQKPEGNEAKLPDFVQHARQLNAMLRGAGVKEIWATEWGWSSYEGPKEEQAIIGREGQADYVLRRLALMSALDYDRIFLFALSDLDSRATVRDRQYGLLDLQGRAKPVYTALASFLRTMGPELEPGSLPAMATAPEDLYSISWQKPDGKQLLVFWGNKSKKLVLKNIAQATLHNPFTDDRLPLENSATGLLEVPVASHVQILEW
ncbi:cellulase family glycosylhydrolase [Thiopseudomonas denitrificans]|uniref:Beta-xylosidase n=1 Tax=Thiopseudomonas denitrificans TaxID=1501432 RepID=A0A4R6TWD4_9GAMM|nr:cellulase family glycosylhydrolase [Thiopseudomonas denitrificans]TDQ37556.1 beta-xylosidase [Thiopseudomonas denitrificans]